MSEIKICVHIVCGEFVCQCRSSLDAAEREGVRNVSGMPGRAAEKSPGCLFYDKISVLSALRENGMSDANTSLESSTRRYQAVLRISEALAACGQAEELAKTLADLLSEFLSFESLDVVIFK